MKVIYLGVTLILLFLSFLAGRFYNCFVENVILKEQTNNKSSPTFTSVNDGRVYLWKEAFSVSPNGRYKGESYMGNYADYYNYHQIFITDLTNYRMWRVYSGDFRTLGWEWTNDNKIKITYDCGTGCLTTKVMGVDETIAFSEDKEWLISKENGWEVEFFESF